MTEDEMSGRHHQLNGHNFEQTLGDGEGQGSLVCSSPWGRKESDMTERLNNISEISVDNILQNFTLATQGKESSVLGEVTAHLGIFSIFQHKKLRCG